MTVTATTLPTPVEVLEKACIAVGFGPTQSMELASEILTQTRAAGLTTTTNNTPPSKTRADGTPEWERGTGMPVSAEEGLVIVQSLELLEAMTPDQADIHASHLRNAASVARRQDKKEDDQ